MAEGDCQVFDDAPIQMWAEVNTAANDWRMAWIDNTTYTTLAGIVAAADAHFNGSGTTNLQVDEVSGGDYTAGGVALTSVTITESGGTVTFDSANFTRSKNASNPTNARWGVIFNNTLASKKAAAVYDLGAVKDFTTGALTLTVPGTGWWQTTTT